MCQNEDCYVIFWLIVTASCTYMEQSHHFIVISYTQAFPVIATQNTHCVKGWVY